MLSEHTVLVSVLGGDSPGWKGIIIIFRGWFLCKCQQGAVHLQSVVEEVVQPAAQTIESLLGANALVL